MSTTNFIDKEQARDSGRRYRRSLHEDQLHRLSTEIAQCTRSALDWANVGSINIYQAIADNHEVKTDSIIAWLNASHPLIVVSLQSQKPVFSEKPVDVIIMPCLAIDETGSRVGYGGGNYDRYLASQQSAQKIVLCFEGQITPLIDTEPHDQRPDLIVTEKRIIRLS